MKGYIQSNFPEDQTPAQLRRAIYEAWDAIPVEVLLNLAASMPHRVQACIRNNGGPTGY
jgi:hypothetical protein